MFAQIPGLMELFVLLLVLLLLALPVLALVVILYYHANRSSEDERIDALESQVEELRAELNTGSDGTDDRE